jgi:hypothetical protein
LKRNLLLLNLALLVLVCFLGWYVRKKWIESRDHEHKVLTAKVQPVPVVPPAPLKKVAPIEAPAYSVVVEKHLFSADRNPNPIIDPPLPPPPPPPMPPLPSAHGVMLWDGVPPTVVLSEKGRPGQKGYHPGDKIGQFTVVSVSNKEVVFDWDGKQVAARLDDMLTRGLNSAPSAPDTPQRGTQPAGPQPTPQGSGATATNLTQGVSLTGNDTAGSPKGPGAELPGQGINSCVAGDNTPPGTIVNGLQKKVDKTPFGVICRWEPAR